VASTLASEFGKINSQMRINATNTPDTLLRSMFSWFSVGVDSNPNCNTNFGSTNTTTTVFSPKCTSHSANTHENIPISTDNFVSSSSVAWNEYVGSRIENYSAPNNSDILDVYKNPFSIFCHLRRYYWSPKLVHCHHQKIKMRCYPNLSRKLKKMIV
jgi:hypothetical protein